MRVAPPIVLVPEERHLLEQWSRGQSTEQRLVLRSQIILRAADGEASKDIAAALETSPTTVGLWRSRFALLRIQGIRKDAPRGSPPPVTPEMVEKIVHTTLHAKPRGESHWSTRTLADELGVSHMTVHRVWKARHLQPHRVQSFEIGHDPRFEEKFVDVVGLYVNPPERAVVFSVDEKPQTQALERTQTAIPLGEAFPKGRPHEPNRNGMIDLFAALEDLTGDVEAVFHRRHRHQEFLSFLGTLDREAAKGYEVHAFMDNLGARPTEEVEHWLQRHPKFHLHLTPTHALWLNVVDGWFSKLELERLRRGSFRSVPELVRSVKEYVAVRNESPKPFTWTKSMDEILRKIRKIQQLSVTAP